MKDFNLWLELCREFGISRKTGYKIFDRYQECGVQGLTDRSRRPIRYAHQLPFQVENYILNVKREHSSWGARKIRERLSRRFSGIKIPAKSTIHAVLDRHGLVERRGRLRHRAQGTTTLPGRIYDAPLILPIPRYSILPNLIPAAYVAQDLLFNKRSFRLADSKRDPSYNNVSMIEPYSNWQGPYGQTPTTSTSQPSSATPSTVKGRNWLAFWDGWYSRYLQVGIDARVLPRGNRKRLAPAAEQSKGPADSSAGICFQAMLQCEATGDCSRLDWPAS
jgi:transposase